VACVDRRRSSRTVASSNDQTRAVPSSLAVARRVELRFHATPLTPPVCPGIVAAWVPSAADQMLTVRSSRVVASQRPFGLHARSRTNSSPRLNRSAPVAMSITRAPT
jgi:hypothetical protein